MTGDDKTMKRVHLHLQMEVGGGDRGTPVEPVEFSFIYGAGASGITPFETALGPLQPGEELAAQLTSGELAGYFGQLAGSVQSALGMLLVPSRFMLRVRYLGSEEATPREVVEFMAQAMKSGGCGCGGGCGCE